MTLLAFVLSAVLIVIAAIHLLWALGYWWPLHDEARLARTVVGTKGIETMPGAVPTSLVTVALLFAAAWPWFPDGGLRSLGLLILALVFQVRALAAYAAPWKRLSPEQPFRRLDETLYGPICIGVGLGFMAIFGESLT